MPGVARPRGERRGLMREAVAEVVGHLVLKAVPPDQRSPLFDQARDLLSEAGWGLDELFEAAKDGPAQRDLFRALGLEERGPARGGGAEPGGRMADRKERR